MRTGTALALSLMLVVPACANRSASSSGATLSGVVVAGPTCPVERPESPCPPEPWSGPVIATAQDGSRSETLADADGRFTFIGLTSGTYTLVAKTDGGPPIGIPTSVSVAAGTNPEVTLQVDTGIR